MRLRFAPPAAVLLLFCAVAVVRADKPGPDPTRKTRPPLLMQKPTVSKTHIVFGYADDLWIVARSGGEARRLTAGPGVETDPFFSPDGRWVAFTGEYDGNQDVFVVPASGGVP